MILYFDIEANGLLYEADHIWMIAGIDDNKKWHIYCDENNDVSIPYPNGTQYYKTVRDYVRMLHDADKIVAHNLMGYDYPLLEKLYGFHKPVSECEDTQIMSSLYEPDVRGGHSIKAWALRLGMPPKIEHNEWDKFSRNMFDRCLHDVQVLKRIYGVLEHDMGKG